MTDTGHTAWGWEDPTPVAADLLEDRRQGGEVQEVPDCPRGGSHGEFKVGS